MQGNKTHEQFERIIHKDVKTSNNPDMSSDNQTIEEARRHIKRPDQIYDIETGDRSIRRGSHQETRHTKHRVDE